MLAHFKFPELFCFDSVWKKHIEIFIVFKVQRVTWRFVPEPIEYPTVDPTLKGETLNKMFDFLLNYKISKSCFSFLI